MKAEQGGSAIGPSGKPGTPFLVLGLPRSRTFWASLFLSREGYHCAHDEITHLRGPDDVKAWLGQDFTGAAETAAAPWWRTIVAIRPDIRIAVIRRSVAEVVDSWMRLDMRGVCTFERSAVERWITKIDRKLDQIERRVPGVLSVRFGDLATEEGCARLYEHCLHRPLDPAWWAHMAPLNLQSDVSAQMRYFLTNRPQLEKLVRTAKQQTLSAMARRPAVDPAGVTFQAESFDDWYRDAAPLFREHMVATGQDVEDYSRKNIPLGQLLARFNAMQIITARCNGRMVAYLMSVVGPSLDDPTIRVAEHMPIFCSPDFPGLGGKLVRAADAALAQRGVARVTGRAGVRGSGPRLGALWRRQGYEEYGELYRLDLKVA